MDIEVNCSGMRDAGTPLTIAKSFNCRDKDRVPESDRSANMHGKECQIAPIITHISGYSLLRKITRRLFPKTLPELLRKIKRIAHPHGIRHFFDRPEYPVFQ